MSLADGVTVNHNLLAIINDLHGKEVLLETKDGRQFLGLLSGCSPEFELGVKYVYERTDENVDNLFPKRSETKEKMSFQFADVIAISALMAEDKFIKGFATDRDYHCGKHLMEDDELQAWVGDDDDGSGEIENIAHLSDQNKFQKNNAGWSVDEMFTANKKFGVQSTYEDDMSQYTTADIVGSEKERAEADRIAKEIEDNARSKYYSRLENDDDERDLDKATKDDDFDFVGKKPRGGNNNRNRGASNQVNRRAEAMKGSDKRSLNKFESGKNSSKSLVSAPHGKRPTGSEVQEQFNEFAQREVTKKDTKKSDQTRVTKILLEHKNGATHSEKSEKSASKIDDLKQWSKDFNEVYIDSKPQATDEKDGNREVSRPSATQPGNAWTKGPPTSLVNLKSNSPNNAQQQSSPVELPPSSDEIVSQLEHSTISCSEVAGVATQNNETLVDTLSNEADSRDDATNTSSIKKFSFNPNAPAFTPRQPSTSSAINAQSNNPSQLPGVPMGFPPGVTVPATMSPQVVAVPGPVVSQWQGAQNQFQQVPGQFQQYSVPAGTPIMAPVTMIPPRGPNQAPQLYQGQNAGRRAQMPPTSTPMIMPTNAQWANQPVMVQPVPYQGYQYQAVPQPGTAAAPPQGYSVANGQQVIPQANISVYQQQRFPPVGYMYHPNGQRYATGQQGMYSVGNESVMQGQYTQAPQANNSGPAGSQPTTPGPQPQPVSSPAQVAATTSGVAATARGSPSPAPPPSQQFSHAPPQPMVAPQYYNNVYMYPLYPQTVTMGHPMVHNAEQHHIDGLMGAPQSQQFSHHEQYSNMIPAQGGVFYQTQGNTSQPMSRQNSLPHSGFVGNQPGIQNQQLLTGPQSTQSSSASQQQ